MAKRFKLKFPSVIPSFQFCRFKDPSSLPKNPKPAIYQPSPVNPKAFDIGYPNGHPAPPQPSTPEYSFVMRRRGASSKKIRSDGSCVSCERSRSCGQYLFTDWSTESPCCGVEAPSLKEKYYIKQKSKEEKKSKSKAKARASNTVRTSVGSNGSWFSSNEDDEDEDSVTLLDSSRSFSNDHPIINKSSQSSSGAKTASLRESFAVVKKSEDPYEDFKRSMLEMIMEKQMFEAADLEELLQCFLTLNSRQYHGVIVEVFSDIWDILFSDSPLKHRLCF